MAYNLSDFAFSSRLKVKERQDKIEVFTFYFYYFIHPRNQVHGLRLLSWSIFASWYHVKKLSCEWLAARNIYTEMRRVNKISTTATFVHNTERVTPYWNRYSWESFKQLKRKLPGYIDLINCFDLEMFSLFKMLWRKVAVGEI